MTASMANSLPQVGDYIRHPLGALNTLPIDNKWGGSKGEFKRVIKVMGDTMYVEGSETLWRRNFDWEFREGGPPPSLPELDFTLEEINLAQEMLNHEPSKQR